MYKGGHTYCPICTLPDDVAYQIQVLNDPSSILSIKQQRHIADMLERLQKRIKELEERERWIPVSERPLDLNEARAALSAPLSEEVAEHVSWIRYWARQHHGDKQLLDAADMLERLWRENAQARKTSEYWKAEHLAGNERIEELTGALRSLVALKSHKSIRGKDSHYLRNQPAAWEQARAALKQEGG